MKLNCIIVDDSTMQRMAITKLVRMNDSLNLVAEYSNAIEAKNGLRSQKVDLIFLDIEMPILNGFDLLESLENPPQVILIAGKTEYAFKAFDYDVTDYLQKPVESKRFDASIERALDHFEQRRLQAAEEEEHIFVKSNLKKRKVILGQIKWIEALGDYIKLVTNDNNIIVLSTMKAFETRLPENRFLRIHKSYIINLERVERFNSKNVEIDGTSIPLSRNKKSILAEALANI